MAFNTTNAYGRISITEEAVAQVAGYSALECYGIVDLVAKSFSDNMAELFKKHKNSRGVKVMTNGDKIVIDLWVDMKYSVSLQAVAEALKKSVRYGVERFTGMIVGEVNVNVVGVKL
ncbi:alkaline-shock protein [Clostridia bacterium]|nr:alkaline-shock protein [Clostridia bacterium]